MSTKPDWKDAPEWAQWVAMDDDGDWFWYEEKPIDRGHGIWSKGSYEGRCERIAQPKSLPDYSKTLEQRP